MLRGTHVRGGAGLRVGGIAPGTAVGETAPPDVLGPEEEKSVLPIGNGREPQPIVGLPNGPASRGRLEGLIGDPCAELHGGGFARTRGGVAEILPETLVVVV